MLQQRSKFAHKPVTVGNKISTQRSISQGMVSRSQRKNGFSQHNKKLAEKGIKLHTRCWNKRCELLHGPQVQKQHATKDTKAI